MKLKSSSKALKDISILGCKSELGNEYENICKNVVNKYQKSYYVKSKSNKTKNKTEFGLLSNEAIIEIAQSYKIYNHEKEKN